MKFKKLSIILSVLLVITGIFIIKEARIYIKNQIHNTQDYVSYIIYGDTTIRPTFSLFDEVGLYSKNGSIENYGLNLRQIKSGPISVQETQLHLLENLGYIFWYPDYSTPQNSDYLIIKFKDAVPRSASFLVGVKLENSEIVHFIFGKKTKELKMLSSMPKDLEENILHPTKIIEMQRVSNALIARLPKRLKSAFSGQNLSPKIIKSFFVGVYDISNQEIRISKIALSKTVFDQDNHSNITLEGSTKNVMLPPGTLVELRTEDGKHTKQQISPEGTFRFTNITPHTPISVRIKYNEQYYFANNGRWFVPHYDQNNLMIDFAPRYTNPCAKKTKETENKFQVNYTSKIIQEFMQHTRQITHGLPGIIQEFASTTFANNLGHIDRDRFMDKPDRCFRIMAVGGSMSVGLQVPICEKFNIHLEEELGIRLQKCVEVMHLGRSNGEIGSVYPRVQKYADQFKPNLILIEHSAGVMYQIQPTLLKRFLGYNFEKSPLDHFYYNDQGTLIFYPFTPSWELHATPPSNAPLENGAPLWAAFQMPEEKLSPEVKEAYTLLRDIYMFYQKKYPSTKIAIFTALDQSKCRGKPKQDLILADGSHVEVSTENFLNTLKKWCVTNNMNCFNLPIPQGFNDGPATYLSFEVDNNFSTRGHQWVARELTPILVDFLRKQGK